MGAFAINLPEGTSKLQMASEINRTYLRPLQLEGKAATQSIDILVKEGFRCDIEPFSPIGLDEPPLSVCIKPSSGFGELCEDLMVTLRFERSPGMDSRAALLDRLDSLKVASALSFCPYQRQATAEHMAARHLGEKELERQVRAFDLLGKAKVARDKLLLEGYYCGFNAGAASRESSTPSALICTKSPSKIRFCFESKIVMTLEWSPGRSANSRAWSDLPAARISAVSSSCEVPSDKGQGAPA